MSDKVANIAERQVDTAHLIGLLEDMAKFDLSPGSSIEDHPCIIAVRTIKDLEQKLAADLERLCQWACDNGYSTGHADTMDDLLGELLPQIEKKLANYREAIEQAHMAGQVDAGVDPSYSNAQRYFERRSKP